MRCTDVHFHNGNPLRCEGERGHVHAHYNGSVWWGNEEGFPDHQPQIPYPIAWTILIVTLALIGLALAWIFIAR